MTHGRILDMARSIVILEFTRRAASFATLRLGTHEVAVLPLQCGAVDPLRVRRQREGARHREHDFVRSLVVRVT